MRYARLLAQIVNLANQQGTGKIKASESKLCLALAILCLNITISALKNHETFNGIGCNPHAPACPQFLIRDFTGQSFDYQPALLLHLHHRILTIHKFLPQYCLPSVCSLQSLEQEVTVAPKSATLFPQFHDFATMIAKFKQAKFAKVVLARSCTTSFTKPIVAQQFAITKWYDFMQQHSFANFFFATNIASDNKTFFISYSPETLCQIRNQKLVTEALAGSLTPYQKESLLHDPKNLLENNIVAQSICQQLQAFTSHLKCAQPAIKRLAYIQHLHAKITARLTSQTKALEIVKVLHPTPATNGFPKDQATQFIAQHNPLPRSLYAGVGGIQSSKRLHAIVLLRSGFYDSHQFTIFGGAGIMPSSDPKSEWLETAQKMTPMLQAFCASSKLYHAMQQMIQ